MQKFIQLMIIFLLILVLSCNKNDGHATVHRTVIEFGTNETIESAMVILQLVFGATSFVGGAIVGRRDTDFEHLWSPNNCSNCFYKAYYHHISKSSFY